MIEGILGRLLAFILFVGIICVAVVLGGSYYVKNRLATDDIILNEGTFVISKGSGTQRSLVHCKMKDLFHQMQCSRLQMV